jgi:hypothetical protein
VPGIGHIRKVYTIIVFPPLSGFVQQVAGEIDALKAACVSAPALGYKQTHGQTDKILFIPIS